MPTRTHIDVTVIGAGIVGLWQALTLARAGHRVRLVERSPATDPFGASASRYAGAMLAPDTEAEAAPAIVRDFGREAIDLWAAAVPVTKAGSLVVAPTREPGELRRFARLTERHRSLTSGDIAGLEPDLANRFDSALFFPDEAHVSATDALAALLRATRDAGAQIEFGTDGVAHNESLDRIPVAGSPAADGVWTIDCRGLAARADIANLRGVRGERLLLRARDVRLSRPVRFLDPRTPIYAVPWPDSVYMIGATVIESEEAGPVSVRSATELMAAASALHPGFAEAELIDASAGVRPSLPDNVPRVFFADPRRRIVRVNGAYRHGFLLSPILARSVARLIAGDANAPLVEVQAC